MKKVYPNKNRRVFVAMSGGVDSSVAAALLKQEGHEVTGVFFRGWEPYLSPSTSLDSVRDKSLGTNHSGQVGVICDWREERRSALRAAAVLGIPLLTHDASEEYRQKIVEPMIADYRAGRTPNPDVLCNRLIKFDSLWNFAQAHGAEMLATGHYAQKKLLGSSCQLLASTDKNKDQTYFLWTLTQTDLAHTLFPIGGYHKKKVRELAKYFKLATANKPDSQGLCFVGQLDFKNFLRAYLPITFGPVRDEAGKVIGEHDGAHFYTIGERHGFRVLAHTATTAPLYVIAKEVKTNTLTVSAKPLASAGARSEIKLTGVNWISGVAPLPNQTLKARIRYRSPLSSCRVEVLAGDQKKAQVIFNQPIFGATPGQSCVFYDADEKICLGGGVIV